MARTAITVTTLTAETATAVVLSSVGGAIDATNSHSITLPQGATWEEILLFVENTTSSTKTATVKAGVNPPAVRQGAGDLVVSLTAGDSTTTQALVPINGNRFQQADGTLNVDIAASMTGRIAAFWLKRNG